MLLVRCLKIVIRAEQLALLVPLERLAVVRAGHPAPVVVLAALDAAGVDDACDAAPVPALDPPGHQRSTLLRPDERVVRTPADAVLGDAQRLPRVWGGGPRGVR